MFLPLRTRTTLQKITEKIKKSLRWLDDKSLFSTDTREGKNWLMQVQDGVVAKEYNIVHDFANQQQLVRK